MRTIENLVQFVLACIIFAFVIIECIVAVHQQWVTGIIGYSVCICALCLTGSVVRLSWKEMKDKEE